MLDRNIAVDSLLGVIATSYENQESRNYKAEASDSSACALLAQALRRSASAQAAGS